MLFTFCGCNNSQAADATDDNPSQNISSTYSLSSGTQKTHQMI